ncbi:PAS domain-containing protein [Spirosoma utsteinense]|uniref:PAS domain-containing protein n=1 Tax=Spirosoma utsteinense TaxID=2585773 RepID=UPI001EC3291F|nr:PAS domain-containing protein [Spirosoma utsteinense]MBC3788328.1 PAS domain S-box-containing protein [Spirosoma utsteinense]
MNGSQQQDEASTPHTRRFDTDVVLQAAGLGLWQIDPLTNLVYWDDYCGQLLGLGQANQLSYPAFLRHIHPQDVDRVDQALRGAMTLPPGGACEVSYRTRGADEGRGQWVRLIGRSALNLAGLVDGLAGVAQAVTPPKETAPEPVRQFGPLQTMLAHLQEHVYVLDREGRFRYVNQPLLALWELPYEQAIGKNFEELGYPSHLVSLHGAQIQQVIQTAQPVDGESDYVSPQGVAGFYEYTFVPLLAPDGSVEAIGGHTRVVTQRRQLEKILNESETKFRTIIEQAPVAFNLLVGRDLVVEVANEVVLGYWGKDRSVLGQPVRQAVPELAGQGFFELLDEVFTSGQAYEAKAAPATVAVNGVYGAYYFDSSLKPLRNAAGQVYAIMSMAVDVTQQVLARREAEAGNRQFRTLLEAIPHMTWTNTPTGGVGFFNERWYAYTGLSFEQTRDWGWQAVVHPDDLARTLSAYQRTLTTGEEFMLENRYRRADGVYRWHLNRALPLYGDDGQIVQWVGTATDIDEQKQLEAQLDQQVQTRTSQLQTSVADLRRSNDNLQQFAYIASHDLQEPLRKIQSFGDILRNQYASQLGEGMGYLERMQSAASRMSTLIKDLLTFSRISTQQEATLPVSLTDVVHLTLSDLELTVQETGAHIRVDPLPTVHGDASQLGQLFQNLLSNALKFQRPDASPVLDVRARLVRAAELPAGVEPTRPAMVYHLIEVADNGIGFDDKYVDRIFQVFQRLHGKSGSHYNGTGIGLAICQKVVANHGGAITATSQPGQGATFSVYLPV